MAGEPLSRTFARTIQWFVATLRRPSSGKSVVRRWPTLPLALTVALAILLAGRLLRLTSRYAVNIFMGDQWDFNNATLFARHSFWQAFRFQLGPHRQGLGAVVEKLVGPLMRWNSRWDSFFICAVIIIAAAAALALKHRLFGDFSYADVLIPLIVLTPVSFESIFGAAGANLSHGSLPLLLAMCYGLAWTLPRQTWRYALILTINFLMIYTGFGFFMGLVTPLALVADWWLAASGPVPIRPWHTAVAVAVALLSLASFFLHYQFTTSVACSPLPLKSPGQYLGFMSLMFADFLGLTTISRPAFLAGGFLVAAMLLALAAGIRQVIVRPQQVRSPRMVALILMGFCVLFCADAAFGRICLGLGMAMASRYMLYLVTGLLGLYFFLLSDRYAAVRYSGILALLIVGVLASATVHPQDRRLMRSFYALKHTWRECYLRLADIRQCDAVTQRTIKVPFPPTVYVGPAATHLQQKMEFLRSRHFNLYADSK